MLSRRHLLLAMGALAAPSRGATVTFPDVVPRTLRFPEDFGAHPDFRTEWWYLTGWLGESTRPIGFQVTFFRVRTDVDPDNPSTFAARQLVIAHAALADPARGRLLLDERIARTGFGLVQAATGRHGRAAGRLVAGPGCRNGQLPRADCSAGLHAGLHGHQPGTTVAAGQRRRVRQRSAANPGQLLLLTAAASG